MEKFETRWVWNSAKSNVKPLEDWREEASSALHMNETIERNVVNQTHRFDYLWREERSKRR
ncbi:MAG: hypothetical protein ACTS5P_00925 [Candidatus Hodgkinia cicadicola]